MQEYAGGVEFMPSLNVSHLNFFDAKQVARSCADSSSDTSKPFVSTRPTGKTQQIGSLIRQYSSRELQVQEAGLKALLRLYETGARDSSPELQVQEGGRV